jgi:hypothetical protein
MAVGDYCAEKKKEKKRKKNKLYCMENLERDCDVHGNKLYVMPRRILPGT